MTDTDLDKLKDSLAPCPFCGGEARCGEYWPSWDTKEHIVSCGDCEMYVGKKARAEAIAAWNRRAPSADLEAARAKIERLEGALGQICIDSNSDWKERRHDPQKALDDIHRIAVDAYYAAENDGTSAVVTEVLAERRRQVAKGYDAAHDNEHDDGMIALQAAAAIARYASSGTPPWWIDRQQPRRAQIIQGIALAIAEVERIDRMANSGVKA